MQRDRRAAASPVRRTFAERLRQLRVQRLLTRDALAAASGISVTTLGAYERGQREPPLSTLVRLADALRVTPDALLGTAPAEADPALHRLFDELRLARPEQVRMVVEFWQYLERKEHGRARRDEPLGAAADPR